MQERILLAPNGTDLIRTLARNGCNTIGLRIMQPAELAQFALMRSGIVLRETFLPPAEEAAVIYRFLDKIPYFSVNYHDAQNLAQTLRDLRGQITGDAQQEIAGRLKDSPFTEKNEAICSALMYYTQALREQSLVDTIGLLRTAIAQAGTLDAELIVLREYPLTPLERALVSHLSGNAGRELTLCEFMQRPASALPALPVTESYGAANEAEYVIASILRDKLPLDRCTVAVTDTAVYVPLLYELICRCDLPATFGCGVPVTRSNAAAVLRDCQLWQTDGQFGTDTLRRMVRADAFDLKAFMEAYQIADLSALEVFLKAAGALRLNADPVRNAKLLDHYIETAHPAETLAAQLRAVFAETPFDAVHVVGSFTKVRKNVRGRLDKAGIRKICGTLSRFSEMTGAPSEKLIPDLLRTRICAEVSAPGALHITDLNGALPVMRENLFVMGLAAELFPGEAAENYLLLDDEMEQFGEDAPTSVRLVRRRQEQMQELLHTAAALGTKTALSYCGYDTAELKANTPSSSLLALSDVPKDPDTIADHRTGYFSVDAFGAAPVGRAYLQGETVEPSEPDEIAPPCIPAALPPLSPSRIEVYLQCPRRFCWQTIMHLHVPEEDKVLEFMSQAEFGTVLHEAMEWMAEHPHVKDAFLRNAQDVFDRFASGHLPMDQNDLTRRQAEFLRIAEAGYDRIEGRCITIAEEKVRAQYPCGITVEGIPDAVQACSDGSLRVLDYKTGRKLKHVKDDPYSCIQVMLYADILRRSGKNVSGGEYLYLTRNESVTCELTDRSCQTVEEILEEIAAAAKANTYPANPTDEGCRYCEYKAICKEGGSSK